MSCETKIQSFAFKLAHRLIPCGNFSQKMKIRESDECLECGQKDTIIHFLYGCRQVQSFWEKSIKWFDDYTDISLCNLSTADLIFGKSKTSHNWRLVNWILLEAKFFIQRPKLFNKDKLHLIHFLAHVKEKLITEKRICSLEGKPGKFRKNYLQPYLKLSTSTDLTLSPLLTKF